MVYEPLSHTFWTYVVSERVSLKLEAIAEIFFVKDRMAPEENHFNS